MEQKNMKKSLSRLLLILIITITGSVIFTACGNPEFSQEAEDLRVEVAFLARDVDSLSERIVELERTETAASRAAPITIPTTTPETPQGPQEPLRIGYLADFSGPLAEFGPEIRKGVELAIEHINSAGGVNGRPVELVVGDTALQQVQALAETRRLIDIEGVHAIVGPLASGITLSVVESVAGDAGIPVISPSATSPSISNADDRDFLFRSTLSDAAQGQVLADLITNDGVDNVAILYLNNPYGQGLLARFSDSYDGNITAISHEENQISYLAELQKAAEGDAEFLVTMGYVGQAQVYLRESLEQGLFDKFYFTDGTRSEDLIEAIGAESLEGFKGTVASSDESSASFTAFNNAFSAKYGGNPSRPYVREAYDATIAIGLAAEIANSLEGATIRDSLRRVALPGGETITAGEDSVRRGLQIVGDGGDVNYEGAATTLDWDSVGDVTGGFVSIWTYQGGEIVDIDAVLVNLK